MDNAICVPGKNIKTFINKKGVSILLRFASVEDAPQMTSYINEISKEDTFINFSGEQLSLEEETKYAKGVIEKMLQGNEVKVLAFVGKELVGSADIIRNVRRMNHFGEMAFSIKKEYRGTGIGHEMMQILIDIAKQLGLRYLELSVFANNIAGHNLYKKVGFKEVGRIPEKFSYRGSYEDAIIMVKKLSS